MKLFNIVVKSHECPYGFFDDGYKFCTLENGPKWCDETECPIKQPSNLENATGARCVCPLCNQPHDPKLISGDGPMTDGRR
jgi:hypothetical protein